MGALFHYYVPEAKDIYHHRRAANSAPDTPEASDGAFFHY
jgi:hypothetical protein